MGALDTPEARVLAFLDRRSGRTSSDTLAEIGDRRLSERDLRAVAESARRSEVLDVARVELKPGDTLLVRPKENSSIATAEEVDEWADWLQEYFAPRFPGVEVLVLPFPSDVAIIEGAARAVKPSAGGGDADG